MADTTIPQFPPHANFFSTPSSRGTLEILWSSLFTIFACTWTIQHLNVPEQRNVCEPGWRGSVKWYTRKFGTSAKWMMITTIAPEVVIGIACYDLLSAKIIYRVLQTFALEDDVPWTLTHSYFANMGGFVMQSGVPEPLQPPTYISLEEVPLSSRSHRESQAGSSSTFGGKSRNDRNMRKAKPLLSVIAGRRNEISYCNPYHLTGRQIWQLRKDGILPRLPNISETELADRSKSDSFVKVIALFQIFWATVQIIVRIARHLVISQLELSVIAFGACAILMYALYWSKPKNIGATTTILQFEGLIPQKVLTRIRGRHTYMGYFLMGDDSTKLRNGSPIRNDATENYHDDGAGFWLYPALVFGATVFGGIHVGAWSFIFPTRYELILWRVASVYSAACGTVIILIGVAFDLFESLEKPRLAIVRSLVFLYITARLALLVETFRTLFFLPPLAYVSTWTANIPHFG